MGELVLLFRSLAPVGALCWLISASPAAASPPRSDAGSELPFLDAGGDSLDPIGLDDSTGRELDRAAARFDEARRRAQQVVNKPTPVHGAVLTSIEAVNEIAHRVSIKLAEGLAFVDTELVFASRATTPAEIAYRLAIPREGVLVALKVCQQPAAKAVKGALSPGARCVDGAPEPDKPRTEAGASAGPRASARPIQDARGTALSLRASAIDKSSLLLLRVAYVAPAPLHGGVVRFHLPARGYDPRVAASEIALQTSGFDRFEPADAATLDAHLPLDVRAQLRKAPAPRAVKTSALCGGSACARSYEIAPVAPAITRSTWLLLDTSPSMEGPARNAADLALASLLALLPETTPLRVFAFAARTQELGRFSPDAAPLKKLSDALLTDLGASTQPARLLETRKAELFHERPRVILLSDGKLDRGALGALSTFRQRGVELWLVALAPVSAEVSAPFTGVVWASDVAGDALDERLRAALSPRSAAGLAAGEARTTERGPKPRHRPRAGESWLSYWLARQQPVPFATPGAIDPDVIRVPAYESAAERPLLADTGMPKESVLSMLRTQLVPEARACLRTDRKGRADYAVSLTFHALFAEREAYDVRVEGRIPDALRACLSDVIARLRIPAFSGRIRVRYPIHTEREPEPPVVELEPDALEQVNRVISGK